MALGLAYGPGCAIEGGGAESGSPGVAYLKGSTKQSIPLTFVRIEPYIVPKTALTGANTERVDTRVLQIIYRFDLPPFPVYAGQQVDVFIQSE